MAQARLVQSIAAEVNITFARLLEPTSADTADTLQESLQVWSKDVQQMPGNTKLPGRHLTEIPPSVE